MLDPMSRLQLAQTEIDRVFGAGFAQANPGLVAAVMTSAASDYAAAHIADALGHSARLVADALVLDIPATDVIVRQPKLMRP